MAGSSIVMIADVAYTICDDGTGREWRFRKDASRCFSNDARTHFLWLTRYTNWVSESEGRCALLSPPQAREFAVEHGIAAPLTLKLTTGNDEV